MKKLIVLTCTLSLLTACGDSIEKKAGEKLAAARAAFEHNDYNEAKLQIDSIKILYPKAFDTRKEGIKLMQQVELKEQQESLVYLDSMLQVKQKEFEAIKNKYTFEKNEEYQKIGNYFWPTQTVEKNLHRSFLRFQVNEQGVMTLTSIYCGPSNIHHVAVKVIAPDGNGTESPRRGCGKTKIIKHPNCLFHHGLTDHTKYSSQAIVFICPIRQSVVNSFRPIYFYPLRKGRPDYSPLSCRYQ